MGCDVPQVAVVPGRLDAVEDGRRLADPVPADAEPVAVRRLRPQLRVEALVDQGVLRSVEQLLDQHRGAGIGKPPTHGWTPSLVVEARVGRAVVDGRGLLLEA